MKSNRSDRRDQTNRPSRAEGYTKKRAEMEINKETINGNQSNRDQSRSTNQVVESEQADQTIKQVKQANNQTDQTIKQSNNRTIKPTVKQSNKSSNRTIKQSNRQTVKQSTNQQSNKPDQGERTNMSGKGSNINDLIPEV